MACCRFRGHEDKIVTMELESGYDETEVQPRVQDRGGEAGDGAGRVGRAGMPGSGSGRERAAALDARSVGGAGHGVSRKRAAARRSGRDRGPEERGRASQGGA